MRIKPDIKLDYKDVLLEPKRSDLTSRKDVAMEREFTFLHSQKTFNGIPIMASNMDGVGTFEVADKLAQEQMFTCLVKTYSAMQLVGFFDDPDKPQRKEYVAYSMGITEEDHNSLSK